MSTDRIRIERTYEADIADVWDLWTTADGIESWWGPDGFSVTVQALDLRPGGQLRYTMTATAAPQVAFMRQHGMPLATESVITYTEVAPQRRLAYTHLVDFVPDVGAYDVGTQLDLEPTETGVRLVLLLDRMHDQTWCDRMEAGWDQELGKLAAVLRARAS